MPDNDESFIEAGIRFTFDPSGFLRGSAEAQDALESTLAEMINFRREANKTEQEINAAIPGIAAALGVSTEEVKDALKDLKKTEQETAKETARIQREESRNALAEKKRALREEEQLARQQQREEMARLRERQQAMREIRDTALAAVGATSLIAGTRNLVGLVGQTAAEGVAASNMAARTGFSAREILAVGTAGALTPGSSRQEALQSMNALARARTEYRLNGHSQLTDLLSSRYGVDISHIMNGSYETAMQRIVADLRRQGHGTQTMISILERSGLTSGGWSNEVLDGRDMHRRIQRGAQLTDDQAKNIALDKKLDSDLRDLGEIWQNFRKDMGHVLMPAVEDVAKLLIRIDKLVKENPNAARYVTEIGAVILALSPVLGGIATLMGSIGLIRAALGAEGGGIISGLLSPKKLLLRAGIPGALAYGGYEAYEHGWFGKGMDFLDQHSDGMSALDNWLSGKTGGLIGRTFGQQNTITDKQAKENQQKAHDFFLGNKWTEDQTAGILARIQLESGFNPYIRPKNGEDAFGLLQWHKDRRNEFAKVFGHGMSEGTFEEQLQFIQHELTHKEKSAGDHLRAAKSAGEAGAIASYEYARPGQTEQDKRRQVLNTAQAAERIRRDHAQMQMAAAVRGGNVHTDNSQKTTVNMSVNNMNVQANDPHRLATKAAHASGHMLMTSSVDTGIM